MNDHPDFFNLSRMTIVLAAGPFGLLLLLMLLDFSWHQLRIGQASAGQCLETMQTITQIDQPNCRPVNNLSELNEPQI